MSAVLETLYRTFMRRNSVYIGFIIGGAFVGERLLTNVADSMWESNNKGKLFKDMEKNLAPSE